MTNSNIKDIHALEVLDSRGNPTISCTITLEDDTQGSAMVPSGASTGENEALELRDGDKTYYNGKGVTRAIGNIHSKIKPALVGKNVLNQKEIDTILLNLDGTDTKSNLGANAMLAVSLSCAATAANVSNVPLYKYLRNSFWPEESDWLLPVPMMNILNGGKHAEGSVDLQEFMVMPIGISSFPEGLRSGVEVYSELRSLLKKNGHFLGVGDEGGFMPKLSSHTQVLDLLVEAINKAGYKPGKDIAIALDPAASEVYSKGEYDLKVEYKSFTSEEMIQMYHEWSQKYPIKSIEDGLAESDWKGFTALTKKIGDTVQIVGDDLFVTNPKFIQKGIEEKAANAVLVKVNQIGTLSESVDAINLARKAGFNAIISHRSGETEDTFISDLAVACNAGQIKTGAPTRSERVAKYNRLLAIESELGSKASYKNPFSQQTRNS